MIPLVKDLKKIGACSTELQKFKRKKSAREIYEAADVYQLEWYLDEVWIATEYMDRKKAAPILLKLHLAISFTSLTYFGAPAADDREILRAHTDRVWNYLVDVQNGKADKETRTTLLANIDQYSGQYRWVFLRMLCYEIEPRAAWDEYEPPSLYAGSSSMNVDKKLLATFREYMPYEYMLKVHRFLMQGDAKRPKEFT